MTTVSSIPIWIQFGSIWVLLSFIPELFFQILFFYFTESLHHCKMIQQDIWSFAGIPTMKCEEMWGDNTAGKDGVRKCKSWSHGKKAHCSLEGMSMNVKDYHCSVSLGILWRENQNTMIVDSHKDFSCSHPKTTFNQSFKITGLAFIGPSVLYLCSVAFNMSLIWSHTVHQVIQNIKWNVLHEISHVLFIMNINKSLFEWLFFINRSLISIYFLSSWNL